MVTPRIGAHVDDADPVGSALSRAARLSQFFLGDPQSWETPSVAYPGGAAALRATATAADVTLYVHAPYVINVASLNNRIRIPSRKLLLAHALTATAAGAAGLVVHPGHVGRSEDPRAGAQNWCKAVQALADAAEKESSALVPVLLENTAGGDNALARRWDRLAQLWDAVADTADRVGVPLGFCLDTCHAHAAGEDLSDIVGRTRAITGDIALVHCNDSRDLVGSGADRHANLGEGTVPTDLLADVVRRAGAPVVCETPGGLSGHRADLALVRQWLEPGFEDGDSGRQLAQGSQR